MSKKILFLLLLSLVQSLSSASGQDEVVLKSEESEDCKKLLEQPSDADQEQQEKLQSEFVDAVLEGRFADADKLLAKGALINGMIYAETASHEGYQTTLLNSIAWIQSNRKKNDKKMEYLLSKGALPDVPGPSQKTALHAAIIDEDKGRARMLLRFGASISARDSDGNTPFNCAVEHRNLPMITLLLTPPTDHVKKCLCCSLL